MGTKTWTILSLAVVAIAAVCWAVWAATVPAEPSDAQLLKTIDPTQSTDYSRLRARLVVERELFFAGQPLLVDFQVLNASDKPVLVKVPFQSASPKELTERHLAAGLPLEHVFSRKPQADGATGRRALVINRSNDPITEIDNDVVYKADGPIEPIVIRPRGIVGRQLDLAKYYPGLTRPGRFLIEWRPYSDALRSLTVELRIMNEERAVIETNLGDVELHFFYEKATNHVENFLDLARRGFYDGTLFHRVIENFMIQGGDPLTTNPSKADQWGTGRGPRTLQQEFHDAAFRPGILGAARGPDVNSASCQFFIVSGDKAGHLTGQYTAFGRVADDESLKTAVKISKVRVHHGPPNDSRNDRPLEPVVIRRIRVEPMKPTSTQPTTRPAD